MATKTTTPKAPRVICATSDRRRAVACAYEHATNDQGWLRANVSGLVQDEYDNYTVRLDVERGRNAAVVIVQVEYNGSAFEVTQDNITEMDYHQRASAPVTCAYCMKRTTAELAVQHVCRTCHHAGIEA